MPQRSAGSRSPRDWSTCKVRSAMRCNNRVEQAHQPTRVRERRMGQIRCPSSSECFLSAFARVCSLFRPRRHLPNASEYHATLQERCDNARVRGAGAGALCRPGRAAPERPRVRLRPARRPPPACSRRPRRSAACARGGLSPGSRAPTRESIRTCAPGTRRSPRPPGSALEAGPAPEVRAAPSPPPVPNPPLPPD